MKGILQACFETLYLTNRVTRGLIPGTWPVRRSARFELKRKNAETNRACQGPANRNGLGVHWLSGMCKTPDVHGIMHGYHTVIFIEAAMLVFFFFSLGGGRGDVD